MTKDINPMTTRIAMWSGPRNISTAMLRSWGNRTDTFVTDEPLYAHYLQATGLEHPGAAEVIAHHEPDWRKVVAWLTGPVPEGRAIWYQKHMTHHLLPDIGCDWLPHLTHAFLIREPAEMLTSLQRVLSRITLTDTGLPQQVELFEAERARLGRTPPVVDSRDIQDNPSGTLGALCESLGVPFDDAMLNWPPGPRATDGIWARHWYANVEKSTTFEPYRPKNEPVPEQLADIAAQCQALYDTLHAHRIQA
jgi:hypothetical protein